MNCSSSTPTGEGRLLEYATGRLHGREARELADHLSACESCFAFVDSQKQLWNLLDIWEPEPVTPTFNGTLKAKLQILQSNTGRPARLFGNGIPRPTFPLAFAGLLVLLAFIVDHVPGERSRRSAFQAAPRAVSTSDAEKINRALDDLRLLEELEPAKDEATVASRSM